MAKRKSIFDDIVGGFVGAAKGVGDWSQSQARTFTNPYINAAGRAIGKNPNLPVSGAKEAITNTAFGVVDVASGPIGRVAVKGARAAAGAVAKTGVVPRATNKLTGKELIVHGSPAKNLPFIEPRVAPLAPKAGSRVFAGRPNVPPGAMRAYSPKDVTRMVHHYVKERSMQAQQLANPTKVITEYSGSAYVATVPKKVLEGTGYFVRSPVPARVVAEVSISGKTALSSSLNQAKDIERITNAYIRAGGKFPKQPKYGTKTKNIKSTIAKNKTRS